MRRSGAGASGDGKYGTSNIERPTSNGAGVWRGVLPSDVRCGPLRLSSLLLDLLPSAIENRASKMTTPLPSRPHRSRPRPAQLPSCHWGRLAARAGETLRAHGLRQTDAFVITNPQVGGLYSIRRAPRWKPRTFAGSCGMRFRPVKREKTGMNFRPPARVCWRLFRYGLGAAGHSARRRGGRRSRWLCAGVFRRGVPFVQIPTTLLAAVDSSVGGKVAVNFGGVKTSWDFQPAPARGVRPGLASHARSARGAQRDERGDLYGAVCSAALFEQLEGGDLEKLLPGAGGTHGHRGAMRDAEGARVEQDEFDKKASATCSTSATPSGTPWNSAPITRSPMAKPSPSHDRRHPAGGAARRLRTGGFLERLQPLIERAGLPVSFADQPGLFDRVVRAMQMDKKFPRGEKCLRPAHDGRFMAASGECRLGLGPRSGPFGSSPRCHPERSVTESKDPVVLPEMIAGYCGGVLRLRSG